MNTAEVLQAVSRLATPDAPIYLVGGAVRDYLLHRNLHDLDFTLSGDTRRIARSAADALNGAFYPLDEERGTYRVIVPLGGDEKLTLDFASLRGDTLEADLRARDFTVNAMAFDLARPEMVIDPCAGQKDLEERRLRACGPQSLTDDPVRALRAVRFMATNQFEIDEDVLRQARKAAGLLKRVSNERVRDEIFRILNEDHVVQSMRWLDRLGLLEASLPELLGLKGLQQSLPHVYDGWEHTLEVVDHLETLWKVLVVGAPAGPKAGPYVKAVVDWLGRYQERFKEYYALGYTPDRSCRSLVMFAALYHDSAKPLTRTVDPDGRIRFFKHEERGTRLASTRLHKLALSSDEIARIDAAVAGHMRIHHLVDAQQEPGSRAVYHFHRDTGRASVDICLLSLADVWGTYAQNLSMERWMGEVKMCWVMLEALWERREQAVAPPRLISGSDLIQEFGLPPGPIIGRILETVREAQATGDVKDREGAILLARQYLNKVS